VRDRRGRVVFDNAVGVAPVELGSKAR
jgi:hypothetical protein